MRTDHGPGMSGSGRRFRMAAVLAVGMAVGVAMMATPVSGHIGNSVSHLWNAHLKAKTDARYYTKAQSNSRYLRVAGTAANAEQLDGLDSTAFLPAAGTAANSEQLDGLDSAAFLRTTGIAADADQLDGLDSSAFLRTTGIAADADQLDGLDSSAFLRSDGKAADADRLDGLDSSQLMRGNGQAVPGVAAIPYQGITRDVLTIGGVIGLRYFCSLVGPTGNGILFVVNLSPEVMNVFVEGEGPNPAYNQVAVGGTRDVTAAAQGAPDVFHIQAQAPSIGTVTIDVGVAHNPSNCHVQAQAVAAR